MIPVNVTLQFLRDGAKDSRRVKLSLDDNVQDVVTHIVQELHLPMENADNDRVSYYLLKQRQALDEGLTLMECGVQEGDILQLAILDPNATMGKMLSGAVLNRLGGKSSSEPLPISALLLTELGQQFPLKHTRALIGRADQKLGYPSEVFDADLSDLDPDKTISRPHALIVYNNGEFTIRDLYSQHGLFLNEQRVSPSKAAALQDGDILVFGTVKVQFRCQN